MATASALTTAHTPPTADSVVEPQIGAQRGLQQFHRALQFLQRRASARGLYTGFGQFQRNLPPGLHPFFHDPLQARDGLDAARCGSEAAGGAL